MNYKTTINQFITSRYNFLVGCAANILKSNTNIEPADLVAELVIYMDYNELKITEYIGMGKLEGFAVSWLALQGRFASSPTNRKYSFNAINLDDYNSSQLVTEQATDFEYNDYENDLTHIYTDEQIKKIMSVDKILDKLNKFDMVLFQAYFIDNLSYDKIVKKYTFFREKDGKRITYKSKKSIYLMMKTLKEKIKYLMDDDDNN